jgi:hypothetical protein
MENIHKGINQIDEAVTGSRGPAGPEVAHSHARAKASLPGARQQVP